MNLTRAESIRRQQDALAHILREPIEQIANDSIALWPQHTYLENILLIYFSRIPYCSGLYALDNTGRQITEYVTRSGTATGTIGWNHANQPYMNRLVPAWGFLLSDIYFNPRQHFPSLTAIQVVRHNDVMLGYIGVDFDLRDLPLTTEWFRDETSWRDISFDNKQTVSEHAIPRKNSLFDKTPERLFQQLEDLLTRRGVFQCQLHFATSKILIWLEDDPYQYRILNYSEISMNSTRPVCPQQDYPSNARVLRSQVGPILSKLRDLRRADEFVYLRHASINLFNGMINLGFSCDGSQYIYYEDFLRKNIDNWLDSLSISRESIINT